MFELALRSSNAGASFMKAGNIMSKKFLALAAVLLLSVQCAWADPQLWVGHYSAVEMTEGHPDYSSARFHHMRITVDDHSRTPTQEYLNLKGTFRFTAAHILPSTTKYVSPSMELRRH